MLFRDGAEGVDFCAGGTWFVSVSRSFWRVFFMLWDALSLLLDLSAGRRPVALSLPPTANGGLPLDTSPLYLSKS